MEKKRKKRGRLFKWTLRILYLISLSAFFYILLSHYDYYLLDFSLRPRHPLYALLKPGGLIGHGVGILGSAMMILLLLYSFRKRTRLFGRAGAIGRWLDVHIFFGSIGPLFVILHSTFKLNGIVSISFWSMILVALSGFLGRYLYVQIPRTIRGNELSLDEIQKQNDALTASLKTRYGLEERELKQIEAVFNPKKVSSGLLATFFELIFSDVLRFFRFRRIRRQLKRRLKISPVYSKEFVRTLTQKALLSRRIMLWAKVHKLFHYWHIFHKPFAVVMYLIMIIHVGVAVFLGYTWIF